MAKVGLKQMVKLDKKLRAAAHAFAKTNKRQRPVGAGTTDELALIALRNAAFELVKAAVTGDDGKGRDPRDAWEWLQSMRANGSGCAMAFNIVKKRPFDLAFKSHEAK